MSPRARLITSNYYIMYISYYLPSLLTCIITLYTRHVTLHCLLTYQFRSLFFILWCLRFKVIVSISLYESSVLWFYLVLLIVNTTKIFILIVFYYFYLGVPN